MCVENPNVGGKNTDVVIVPKPFNPTVKPSYILDGCAIAPSHGQIVTFHDPPIRYGIKLRTRNTRGNPIKNMVSSFCSNLFYQGGKHRTCIFASFARSQCLPTPLSNSVKTPLERPGRFRSCGKHRPGQNDRPGIVAVLVQLAM